MKIQDSQAKELRDMLVAEATSVLGGGASNDYAVDAEDVAMDALIKLLEHPKDDNPFILGKVIVHNLAKNFRRDKQRRTEIRRDRGEEINQTLNVGWSGDSPDEVIEAEERLTLINKLSPKLRDAFRGYVVEGIPYPELAEREGCTEAVLRKRIQRAKEMLEKV
jgi:RNA polymerase sigma factor (sigma-70 family)